MHTESNTAKTGNTTNNVKPTPFEQVLVTITKQDHIKLVADARYWESAHHRAVGRIEQMAIAHRRAQQESDKRETQLLAQLEDAQAKIRDLQQRLFGRKSEQRRKADLKQNPHTKSKKPRGQQLGGKGHGRAMHSELATQVETIALETPNCPCCGLQFADFPGTEDSEVLEIEVKAYRRVIQRKRYRPTCQCGAVPGIVTAPPPARLIPRGKYGISIWVTLLLSKFLYCQPTQRLLREMSDLGLRLAPGTIAGGLQALAPLFAPLEKAWLQQLRSEGQWHADETRWMVFVEVQGKVGHRWYLWVFHSPSVIHYVLDPSRAATVPDTELGHVEGGIINCDRYSAYKKFARLHPSFILAYCWAHQRRDFLELANAHPELTAWALDWVDKIGQLYYANKLRLAAQEDDAQGQIRLATYNYEHCDQLLHAAVEEMAAQRSSEMANPALATSARKLLESMENHWAGLTVFVDHPEVPMDNNEAERTLRTPVVGRKNFYGSGSQWSGQFAAIMFSLLMTINLWGMNPRTWLSSYLHACAANDNQAPLDLSPFLPWCMDCHQLAAMRGILAHPDRPLSDHNDTS